MAYNSYFYVLFLLAAVVLYYLLPKNWRWLELLLVSCVYYLISAKKYIVFLLFSTVTIYLAGRLIEQVNNKFEEKKAGLSREEKKQMKKKQDSVRHLIVVGVVLCNILVLVWRKYFTFITSGINIILDIIPGGFLLPELSFLMPLGISFYTLQAISYVVDVGRGKYPVERHFGKVMLYLWFFPQMVQGPISRFDQTGEQLFRGNSFDYQNITFGLQRFCYGMLKKVVIADRLNVFVYHIQSSYEGYGGVWIPVVALAYTAQLYAEFSGCMDMVIGSAEMFGVKLPENFDQPFRAKTVAEYWRRWHITLGTWFKDYVFYSVSLSSPVKNLSKKLKGWKTNHVTKLFSTIAALFAVWTLTGIWHGASGKYVLYGWYYFVIITAGVLFEPLAVKVTTALRMNREGKLYGWFQRTRTFVLINIGLLLFRVETTGQFFHMMRSMFQDFTLQYLFDGTLFKLGLDQKDFMVLAVFLGVMWVVSSLKTRGIQVRETIAGQALPVRFCIYLGMIVSTILFGAYGQGYASVGFIYANF